MVAQAFSLDAYNLLSKLLKKSQNGESNLASADKLGMYVCGTQFFTVRLL